jgi:hypothetical protein
MASDDRFTFVNDTRSEIGLEKDKLEEHTIAKEEAEEILKRDRKYTRNRVIRASIFMFVVSSLLVLFGLIWMDEFDTLIAWTDALWLAFVLEFFVGWILLIYNMNIMSPLIYGFKSFFLMFVGKRPSVDYYHYMQDIYDNPIPSFYYKVLFASAFILLIPALITLFIVL